MIIKYSLCDEWSPFFSKKVSFAKNYYILSFTSKPSKIVNCELKNITITIDIAEQKSYNSTVTKIEVL